MSEPGQSIYLEEKIDECSQCSWLSFRSLSLSSNAYQNKSLPLTTVCIESTTSSLVSSVIFIITIVTSPFTAKVNGVKQRSQNHPVNKWRGSGDSAGRGTLAATLRAMPDHCSAAEECGRWWVLFNCLPHLFFSQNTVCLGEDRGRRDGRLTTSFFQDLSIAIL